MGLDNPLHIAFLLILLLLVFGAKRLPEIGQSLGSGLRGFKRSLSGEDQPAALGTTPEHQPGLAPQTQPALAPRTQPALVSQPQRVLADRPDTPAGSAPAA